MAEKKKTCAKIDYADGWVGDFQKGEFPRLVGYFLQKGKIDLAKLKEGEIWRDIFYLFRDNKCQICNKNCVHEVWRKDETFSFTCMSCTGRVDDVSNMYKTQRTDAKLGKIILEAMYVGVSSYGQDDYTWFIYCEYMCQQVAEHDKRVVDWFKSLQLSGNRAP